MSNNITRFGKGTLTDSYQEIYRIPVDFIGIIKTMSFTNIGPTEETISIKLDGNLVLKDEPIKPDGLYNLKAYDQILEESETIEIKASANDSISFYISGVQAPIDNIGSETQWMKDRWDEWWSQMGPDHMETEWQTWFNSIQDSTYVTNSEVDDKIESEMNVYEISFNDQLQSIQETSDQAVADVNNHLTNEVSAMDVHGVRVNDSTGYLEVKDTDGWKEISTSELYRLRMETQVIRQNQVSLLIENDISSDLELDEVGYWYDSLTNDRSLNTLNVFDQRIKVVS